MKKKVIIIGGGISGLGAAAELLVHDLDVTILEAKDRLGGRICTISENDSIFELGAEFLHGENKDIRQLITEAHLSTTEVLMENQVFEGGELVPEEVWEQTAAVIHQIDPKKPDLTFEEFLKANVKDPKEKKLATAFVNGFHAADIRRIGAHSLLRGEYAAEHMASQKQSRFDRGYRELIDFLEKRIHERGGRIKLSSAVETVTWEPDRVVVKFSHKGKQQEIAGNAVLVTVSLGVLKSGKIHFVPPLSMKKEAIDGLQFGNVVKVMLEFRHKCWPEFSFLQWPGAKIPTWWASPNKAILTAWAGGPQADALADSSPEALEALALEELGTMFPAKKADLRRNFIRSHYHNWTADEFVRGAYSYIPVNGLDLPKLLAAPVKNTLFFAGEATVFDAQTGLVSESYLSALRAVREILAGE